MFTIGSDELWTRYESIRVEEEAELKLRGQVLSSKEGIVNSLFPLSIEQLYQDALDMANIKRDLYLFRHALIHKCDGNQVVVKDALTVALDIYADKNGFEYAER